MDGLILQKLNHIENEISKLQAQSQQTFQFFNNVLNHYEITTNKQSDHPSKNKILELIRTDQDLRYPHLFCYKNALK